LPVSPALVTAETSIMLRTVAGVRSGLTLPISPARPVTKGAANDVPETILHCPVEAFPSTAIASPGAATCTLRWAAAGLLS